MMATELDQYIRIYEQEQVMDELTERFKAMQDRFPTREDHPRWKLEDGVAWLRKVVHQASRLGWRLSITGNTVVAGDGQDLDVMAVRWKEDADYTRLVTCLENHGGCQVVDVSPLNDQVKHAGFVTPDGHLIDLVMLGLVVKGRFAP